MAKQSAGILLYRLKNEIEVFLVHPGGPFFKNKDIGSWTIPKGELFADENPLDTAKREFFEETGQTAVGKFVPLESITQKGGKQVQAWALEGDIDAEKCVCNLFEIEWPPRSGKKKSFPEVDKYEWLSITSAREKINPAQIGLLDQLAQIVNP
jgi:predicted NUDIX family NTP pyrophosphohydrolase